MGVSVGDSRNRLCGCWWGWSGLEMKLVYYNVRGLGWFEKKEEVRRFIQDNNPFFFFYICKSRS